MKIFSRIILTIAITIISLSLYSIFFLKVEDKIMSRSSYKGDASIGGDFTLTDINGHKISTKDYKNKLRLVYFGFTYCPDICPAGLIEMSHILENLGKDANKLQAFFITIDPERDTQHQLKEYMQHFDSRIIALTGTKSETDQVADMFKVYRDKQENPHSPKDYMLNHSSFIYLISVDGKYLQHFSGDMDPAKIAKEIRSFL